MAILSGVAAFNGSDNAVYFIYGGLAMAVIGVAERASPQDKRDSLV